MIEVYKYLQVFSSELITDFFTFRKNPHICNIRLFGSENAWPMRFEFVVSCGKKYP